MKKRLKALENRVAALEAPADTPPATNVAADAKFIHHVASVLWGMSRDDLSAPLYAISDRLAAAKPAPLKVPASYAEFDKRRSFSARANEFCNGVEATLAANGQSVDDLPDDGGLL